MEEGAETKILAPVLLEDAPLIDSKKDSVYTGGYQWQMVPGQLEAEVICSSIAEFNDLLPDDRLICQERGWQIDLTEIPYNIIWEDGSNNKIRQINRAGTYQYHVDHCDISFSESIEINVEICDCQFYIPNVFSPDGNQINDHFEVLNKCGELTNFQLSIFSRWGELVYYSTDQYEYWDGSFKGKGLNSGVFCYLLQYESSFTTQAISKTGTITLLRNN